MMRKVALASLMMLLLVMPVQAADKIHVIASFSILGDMVEQIAGDRAEVAVLVGPNGDAHTFEPLPSDAKKLANAKFVLVNGLGLDPWMDRLVSASG
jgi:zinc/manganese transport system substrate-binding protein